MSTPGIKCSVLGCNNWLNDGVEKRTGTCTECLRGVRDAGERYER